MTFQQRIQIIEKLGQFLSQAATNPPHEVWMQAYHKNNWFTTTEIQLAINSWAQLLTATHLQQWLLPYTLPNNPPKGVAIIMAGNIPLVGFHDLLCVLITGNKAIVKLSESDTVLMQWIIQQLLEIEPALKNDIEVLETRLPQQYDAVIATGSNNTNRYFEYYFRNKPSLLRKNRNSVAILTGNETTAELQQLGTDVFTYFGLGCRNVSKLYVPLNYNFTPFYEAIEPLNDIINHHKYANNYTYHKAIFLMNLTPHLDNNFLLVKEDESIASPLGVLFYEYYTHLETLQQTLDVKMDQIQCIVSNASYPNAQPLGQAQQPALTDYADGVDTIEFLMKL